MLDRSPLEHVLSGAGRKTAILDSNLLVLLISARLGIESFGSFKRIQPYEPEDIALLNWLLLSQFRSVVTTSAVLAETSNLANALTGGLRNLWFQQLAQFATDTNEVHLATQVIGRDAELVRFGFTDAVLARLSDTHVLITSDFRLVGVLQDAGRQALNFNNLRTLWLLRPN
jgi:hypothetical protein